MVNEKAEIFAGIDTHKKTYAVATCDVHGSSWMAAIFAENTS